MSKSISDFNEENMFLKNEVYYLKGKVEAYEWFLRRLGVFKGGEDE